MKVKYLAHSAVQLTNKTYNIIIHPFISENPNSPMAINDIDVDYIILTHAHGDHLGDAIEIALRCNSTIICVNELGIYLSNKGLKVHKMHIGGGYNFPFGRVKFTIAHHGSSNSEGMYMGEPAGVILTIDDKKIYHCGDTGLFLDMKLIGEIDIIDLMFVPIGDNYTMGIDDAVRAVGFVNPKLSVPIHYNTFPIIAADPYEFTAKVKSIRKNAIVMEYGQEIEL